MNQPAIVITSYTRSQLNRGALARSVGIAIGLVVTLLVIVLIGLYGAPPIQAATITRYVAPDGTCNGMSPCYANVQAAVNASSDGDEIRVATGTYTGVQTILALNTNHFTATQYVAIVKSITLRGGYSLSDWNTSNPEANPTTLDAQGLGRVVVISGTIAPTVEGFSITGGNATGLGGDIFYSGFCSPGNSPTDGGGGIYIARAAATIRHNRVYSNVGSTTTYGGGAGIMLHCSGASVIENTIWANIGTTVASKPGRGGGILAGGTGDVSSAKISPLIQGNLILTNTAGGDYSQGGGIYLDDEIEARVIANIIRGNVAATTMSGTGGGVYVLNCNEGHPILLDSNWILSNRANLTAGTGAGGGITVQWCHDFTLSNNIIAENRADSRGSGVFIEGLEGTPLAGKLINNTIAANGNAAGAVHVFGERMFGDTDVGTVMLTNTLIATQTTALYIETATGITVTVHADHTLWNGGGPYTSTTGTGHGYLYTTNDLVGNPAFVGSGDYHLTADSAAIDAGANTGLKTDIDGDARPVRLYDIGADEFPVAADATPALGGTLVFTTTGPVTVTLDVPPGAVTSTTTLMFTPKPLPHNAHPTLTFAGHDFVLDAYRGGSLLPGFTFDRLVTITLSYTDADVQGISESTLALQYWNGLAWSDAGINVLERNPATNRLVATIAHLSEFALFGPSIKVYLPTVMRN